MPVMFLEPPPPAVARRSLTPEDAVDVWIARWLGTRRKDLITRYNCDPRRLYEIWEGAKFPESRALAFKRFEERFPQLLDRVDFGPHQRIPHGPCPAQLSLFEDGM